ncbi:Membrane protein involved in the export of O-antigen and teichoic acid [Raineyella antarctica]|uniref:Membrane protein involved in the export of O-antigen and teichoic acid n=1 Tax=Raineyella antarctica TaxID=1577474 RepID=A0A1G6H702_9ACTN|nr:hypothetical protein [Raineyella antarctica]SDB89888.1 Membrane protein involved in the export of O-antigen and teichoic acid [Raineyella antarctica]
MRSPGRVLVPVGIIGTALAQWAIVLIFARRYGEVAVGDYSILYSIATPTFVAAQFGLRDVYLTLSQRFAPRSYLTMRLTGIVLGVAVLVAVGLARGLPIGLTLAMAAMKVGESVVDLRYAFVQSANRMTRLGTVMIGYAIGMITVVLVSSLIVPDPALPVALTGLLGVGIAIVDSLVPLPGTPTRRRGYSSIMRAAVPVTMSHLLFSLVTYTPIFLLGAFGDRAQVGVYTGASYLLVLANLIGSTVQTLLLPRFRDLRASGRRSDLLGSARRSFVGLAGVGAVGAVVAIAFGPQVLGLVYGQGFVMERGHLAPLVLAAAIVAPGYILNALLLVFNAYRAGTVSAAATLAGSFAFGLAVTYFTGSAMLGASWAALGGSLTRIVVSGLQVIRRVRVPEPAVTAPA